MVLVESLNRVVDGKEIKKYVLKNNKGSVAEVMNFGGILLSLNITDKNGESKDRVLGFEDFDDYLVNGVYFGSTVGRCANRIGGASFELNGVKYDLAKNDGNNHLHGGNNGFNKKVWDSEIVSENGEEGVKLSYFSKDGEENYPGNLQVSVIYKLTDNNELVIEYFATTDKDTVVNLTNHSYFNLSGHNSGSIINHKLKIYGDKITATDSESIPTGEIRNIKGTPMDFTELRRIGEDIDTNYDQINMGRGYDHNWIIDGKENELNKVADVVDDNSGLLMEVYSTKPGVQLYTGNFLDGTQKGKGGYMYNMRDGLCLETQFFPNAINVPSFSTPILRKDKKYNHKTIYKFSIM